MQEFELLLARTGDVPLDMPWRRDRQKIELLVEFQQHVHSNDGINNLTAVIGRNGTGKSHLLSAIVDTFVRLEKAAHGKPGQLVNLPLQELKYRVGQSHCLVRREANGQATLTVDGHNVSVEAFPLPQKVVALTTSPFDKFVVPAMRSFSLVPEKHSLYSYLGLRDRTGRAALENLLFRSLNSLFETTENEALRRANIGKVFDFLGLRSRLSVIYNIKVTKKILSAVSENKPFLNEDVIGDHVRLRRAREVLKSAELSERDMADLLRLALDKSQSRMIRLSADFVGGGEIDPLFNHLRPLRRAGFLQLRAVEITQKNGVTSDLKRASSGQLSMAASLLSLSSEINHGSLVLIDEPELSLHPQWQVKYIGLLLQTFANYYGCHFVVATHSPMVISELPRHATVLSLDDQTLPAAEELAGESADFLLAEAFGLTTNNNRYVKDRIVSALRLAANGQVSSKEFKSEVAGLRKLADGMDDGTPAKSVIQDLENVLEQASKGGQPRDAR